jgi:hypothetical protein
LTKEKQKSAKFVAMILAKEVLEKYELKPTDIMRGMVIILNPTDNTTSLQPTVSKVVACELPKPDKGKELNLDAACAT